jgi:hypothetical protein
VFRAFFFVRALHAHANPAAPAALDYAADGTLDHDVVALAAELDRQPH